MPFTPYHVGPHACVALPLHRYLDVPVFIGANVVVDIEPLLVMVLSLDYPLHGYCHTLLIGGALGLLWGIAAFGLRPLWTALMAVLGLPYESSRFKMAVSGMLGACLHVLFDAMIYAESNLFWPIPGNPLAGLSTYQGLARICTICFLPAFAMYGVIVMRGRRIQE